MYSKNACFVFFFLLVFIFAHLLHLTSQKLTLLTAHKNKRKKSMWRVQLYAHKLQEKKFFLFELNKSQNNSCETHAEPFEGRRK